MIAQGIHPSLGMQIYHDWRIDKDNLADGVISCSMLKAFSENPYAWYRQPAFEPTAAMRKGSLFDLALTDPDALNEQVAISPYDDFRTKAAQEWKRENADKLVVTESELDHAKMAAYQVRTHKVAGEILDGAEFQVGVIGEIEGIPAKALLDILPSVDGEYGKTIWDYKTTSAGLSDDAIKRTIGKYKYHFQSAFYKAMFNKVSADRVCTGFGFIFQDVATLETRCVLLSQDALATGARLVRSAVAEYVKCANEGIKSRYAESMDEVDLLPWDEIEDEK